MFLVVDWVDGTTLAKHVRSNGPVPLPVSIGLLHQLAATLGCCHGMGVVHRDVKPANIMLYGRSLDAPVLVDFGLSFNNVDFDDLTRVGEEVGNRFLRLPEHAFGARTAVGDVTQLGGLVLYAATGYEPKILIDESGSMPHQRGPVRQALAAQLEPRTLQRVLGVFDQVFAYRPELRYQSAAAMATDLEAALDTSNDASEDPDAIMAQLDEVTLGVRQAAQAEKRRRLEVIIRFITQVSRDEASTRHLAASQTAYSVIAEEHEVFGETTLGWAYHNGEGPTWVKYRVEFRGDEEFVVSADGKEIWRGMEAGIELARPVRSALAARFLEGR